MTDRSSAWLPGVPTETAVSSGLTVPEGSARVCAMQVTIEIPDDLAERLDPQPRNLLALIKRGLRQQWSETSALAQEVVDFLARGPQPGEILTFRPSDLSVQRAGELLDKNRAGTLTPDEQAELDEMASLNHLFSLIKAHARQHLPTAS